MSLCMDMTYGDMSHGEPHGPVRMRPWPAREPRGCLVVFWSEVLEARGEKAASEDRAGLGCEEAVSSGPGFVLGGPLQPPTCLGRTLCPFIQHTDISFF